MSGKDTRGHVSGLLSPILEHMRMRMISRHIRPGSDILDVGCGRGRLLDFAAEPSGYTGVDILEHVLAANRLARPDREFLLLDIEEDTLPPSFGPFDAVVIGAALEHFKHPAETLSRLRAHLKPGGTIVLTTPAPSGGGIIEFCSGIGLLSREAADEHQDLYSEADINRLAQNSGLGVVRFERFLFGLNQLAVLADANGGTE